MQQELSGLYRAYRMFQSGSRAETFAAVFLVVIVAGPTVVRLVREPSRR